MIHQAVPFRRAKAADQYLSLELNSRLETADPHRLVAILYEELERSFDVLSRTMAQGRDIKFHPQTDRARSILVSLEASLDFKAGGQLSETLAGVYRSMRKELALVTNGGNTEGMQNLRQGILSVSTAWAAIRS
jgi:flagellar secretion chaperone FliS